MENIVLVLSGGMDSAVLLYHLLDAGHAVKTLSVNYGQRHVRELDSAAALRVRSIRCWETIAFRVIRRKFQRVTMKRKA